MARLPIDIMGLGVRENLPNAEIAVRASGSAFGADVGRSLQGFGEAGQQLAGVVQAYEKKKEGQDAQLGFVKAQDADGQAVQEAERNISGDAKGYWQNVRAGTQARMDAYLASLPEDQRREFAPKAAQLVALRTQQAFAKQYQQADANTKLLLDEEARKGGLQVNDDPNAYKAVLDQQIQNIQKSTLTDIEKKERIAKLKNSLAVDAELSKAKKDPAAIVDEGAGGGLRAKIRGKESSGDDSAQNPNSTARGRYQFTKSTWNGFAGRAGVPAVGEGGSDPRDNGDYQEKVMTAYIADSTAKLTSQRLPVTDANLYLLHFMGQSGGAEFLHALNKDAGETAATRFPAEAKANRSIFYNKEGGARSLSEVYAVLTKGMNGAGVTPSTPSASRSNLNADQTRAVDETARRQIVANQNAAQAANDAATAAAKNALYIDLKEGSAPNESYAAARKSGLLSDYDDIKKAEGIIASRQKGDDDLTHGLGMMQPGRVSNQFDKADKAGADAVYKALNALPNADPAASAAAVFDKTGVVPGAYSNKLRGDLASGNAERIGKAAASAAAILRSNINALDGVEGGKDVEAAGAEFERLRKLDPDMSETDIAQRIQRDKETAKDPIKSEVIDQFKKTYLTDEKLGDRMQSQLSGWFGSRAKLPEAGVQRMAIVGAYKEFADEGMRQYHNADRAIDYADRMMKKQFGTQNGIITRYPPEKAASIPELPGLGKTWMNKQGADAAMEYLGAADISPDQITFLPITRGGIDTASAFRTGGAAYKLPDGRDVTTVPYQIMVMPKPPKTKDEVPGVPTPLPIVFYPDVKGFVEKRNAEITAQGAKEVTLYDAQGLPYQAPAYAPELLETPEQIGRRKQAEADTALRDSQTQERARRAREKERMKPIRAETADEAMLLGDVQSIRLRKPGQ